MALEDVLAKIPGYGGFLAKRQMNEREDAAGLQEAMAVQQFAQRAQAARREQAAEERQAALLARINAIPPEKRNKETILPILLEFGLVKEALPAMAQAEKAQPIGAGGLLNPDGTITPPAPRPAAPPTPTNLERLIAARDALPQGHPNRAIFEAGIKKETEGLPRAPQQPSDLSRLMAERDALPPNHPNRAAYDAAIRKATEGLPKPAAEGFTPENAGKVAMSQQAIEGIGTTRGMIFDENGRLNRMLVGAMNLPLTAGMPANSQARMARTAMRNAVEAKLRIETGAAATESEVERTLARFMPTIADTDSSAKYKLDELEKFFKNSLSLTKGLPKAGPQRLRFDAQGNPIQ